MPRPTDGKRCSTTCVPLPLAPTRLICALIGRGSLATVTAEPATGTVPPADVADD